MNAPKMLNAAQTTWIIFVDVLLPVLSLIGAGALLQRLRPVDVHTLVQLNLYIFVPAFLFVRIGESDLSWAQIGKVGLACFLPMLILGVPLWWVLKRFGASGQVIAAVIVGGLFSNAGNFGIPVSELAFGKTGGQVQALVVMFANMTVFFFGYAILAMAQGGKWTAVLGYFKLPMIYAIAAALILREFSVPGQPVLPESLGWLTKALKYLAGGMVPVALLTLGVQLARKPRWPDWKLVGPVVALKLLVFPAVTAAVVLGLGLWPWPGAQIILSAAGPAAINTLLLAIELKGDADSVADCIFWSTLFSAPVVAAVLVILHLADSGALPVPG